MKKFRAKWDEIKEYSVVKETAKQLVFLEPHWTKPGVFSERREAKRSDYQNWFDTWDEAHQFLIEETEAKIRGINSRLTGETLRLKEIQAMSNS